jgi:NAD(P)-dependent dehydrogenase (short-subunit alcohol dehydrogenase family)
MGAAYARLLDQQVALVTGGGAGIGAALALGLAAHGADVIVAGPKLAPLQAVADDIRRAGGRAWAFVHDVSDRAACHALAARVGQEAGSVSILVNNAGIIRYATMDDPAVEQAWTDIVQTNLGGAFNMVRAFLEPLKANRGVVINLASIAAFVYTNNTVAYTASKGGVRSLTVAMARELGVHGIRVNAIAPGAVNTKMSPSAQDPEKLQLLLKRVPLGRIGQPQDVVGPAVFLASSMASYVTGTTLVVDGGYLTT